MRILARGQLAVLFLAVFLSGCGSQSNVASTEPGSSNLTSARSSHLPSPSLRGLSPQEVEAVFTVTTDWGTGFGEQFTLTNHTLQEVQDWTLEFDFPHQITSIWNAEIGQHSGTHYLVSPAAWNASIPPGGTVSFGFNGSPGNVQDEPANLTVASATTPAPPPEEPPPSQEPPPASEPPPAAEGVTTTYRTTTDWGSGFGGEIAIHNGTAQELSDWRLAFDLDAAIGSIWNVRIAQHSGSSYRVEPESWNQTIAPGATVTFGFNGAPGNVTTGAVNFQFSWDGGTVTQEPPPEPAPEPSPAPQPPPTPTGARLVAYFPEWGIYQRAYYVSDIPADRIDIVNYAFADISAAGEVILFDRWAAVDKPFPGDTQDQPLKGNFNQLIKLKASNPHLVTMISVGGWTLSGRFSDVALTPESRRRFAASAVDFMKRYGFDGVDIDWEYPVGGGLGGNTNRPEDKQNFTLLLDALRVELDAQGLADGRSYYLSAAMPAGFDKYQNIELAKVGGTLDWVNLMTYDFHGGWERTTNHHAPLYANPSDPSGLADRYNVDSAVQAYLGAGVPAEKLLVGVPAYGCSWKGVPSQNNGLFQAATGVPVGTWDATGVFDYKDLVTRLAGQPADYVRHWDDRAKAPFVYAANLEGGVFISYEDTQSLQAKLDYVTRNGLGGVMMWDLSSDVKDPEDPNSLVGTVQRWLGTGP